MARELALDVQFHPGQQQVHESPSPNKVVLAGRGWGKTRFAAIDCVLKGLQDVNWAGVPLSSESEVMYMAPTFDQAKGIFWPILKMVADPVTDAIHENTGLLTLINGVRIRLKGMDNPDRARGFILRHAVLDEFADMDPTALTVITGPSVMKTNGTTLLIGTPKRGRPQLGERYQYALEQPVDPKLGFPRWAGFRFKSTDNPWLSSEAIEAYARGMTYEQAREELEAEVLSEGGGILDPKWWRLTRDEPTDGFYVVACDLGGFTSDVKSKTVERRDDTAIAIVKIFSKGWWVKEIQYGRWDTRETALRIVKAGVACDATRVGIEKGALYNAVQPYITDLMGQFQKFRRLEPLTHGNKHKADRVMSAIEGRLQRGRIWLNGDVDKPLRDQPQWIQTLVSQAADFPSKYSRDDLIDALSYADQLGTTTYARYDAERMDNWQPVDDLVGF